jgi:hypothetical protein
MLPDIRLSKSNTLIFLTLVIFFGLTSIYLGKDINWDLRNYHFYNSYSFFNGRLKYDYLPAQIQTFHNPFLHLIIYQIITHFTPKISGFIIGGFQGINCFIIFSMAQIILPNNYSPRWKLFLSLLIAVLGASSPMFISEIGTTLGDNLTSLLVLLGFLFIIRNQKYNYLISGLFFGCSIGFKLTNLVYGLAILITVIIIQKRIAQKISKAISIIIGLSVGILLTGGYWMWMMLENYKNPLFPYYNAIFKSPYFSLVNFRDERFIPKNIIHAISYPFLWAVKEHPSLELAFRDFRWLIIGFLFIILALKLIIINLNAPINNFLFTVNSTSHENLPTEINTNLEDSNQYIILLFTFLSFFIWLFQFGYQRYLIPLELMSGLATFCLLNQIIKRKWFKINLFICLTILIITTTQSPSWGRVSWNKYWLEVITPNIELPDTTLVIMVGTEPTSYVIPFFPKRVRFVRIDGNFARFIKNTLLEKEITEIIQKHQGNFLMLCTEDDNTKYLDILNTYNLQISKERCQLIKSQFEEMKLCPVNKLY